MTPRVAVIVQARVGSARLSGKIFKSVVHRPILGWVLAAAAAIPGVDVVVVTTTPRPDDDAVEQYCDRAGVPCSRGQVPMLGSAHNDVLAGYVAAAHEAGLTRADVVIRVTADCPLLDPIVAGDVLAALRAAPGAGYASNVHPPTWYDGCDAEAFTAALLRRAAAEATDPYDREHVTPWMVRRAAARVNVSTPDGSDWSGLKLSVDAPADLVRVRRTANALSLSSDAPAPGWRAVVAAYRRTHPSAAEVRARKLFPGPRGASRRAAYLAGSAGAAAPPAPPLRAAWAMGREDADAASGGGR